MPPSRTCNIGETEIGIAETFVERLGGLSEIKRSRSMLMDILNSGKSPEYLMEQFIKGRNAERIMTGIVIAHDLAIGIYEGAHPEELAEGGGDAT